jgi:hypothetical protein
MLLIFFFFVLLRVRDAGGDLRRHELQEVAVGNRSAQAER